MFSIRKFHVEAKSSFRVVVLDTSASSDSLESVAAALNLILSVSVVGLIEVLPERCSRLAGKNGVYVDLPSPEAKDILLGRGIVILDSNVCRIVDPNCRKHVGGPAGSAAPVRNKNQTTRPDGTRPMRPPSAAASHNSGSDNGSPHSSAWQQPTGSSAAHRRAKPTPDSSAIESLRAEIQELKRVAAETEAATAARIHQLEVELDETRRMTDAILKKMDSLGAEVSIGFQSITELVSRQQAEPTAKAPAGRNDSATKAAADKPDAIPAPSAVRQSARTNQSESNPSASAAPKTALRHGFFKRMAAKPTDSAVQPPTSGTVRGRENTDPTSPSKPSPAKQHRPSPSQLTPLGHATLLMLNGETSSEGYDIADQSCEVTLYSCNQAIYMEVNEAASSLLRSADVAEGEGCYAETKSPLGYKLRNLGVSSFVWVGSLLLSSPLPNLKCAYPQDTQMVGLLDDTFRTDSSIRLLIDDDTVRRDVLRFVAGTTN